MTGKGAAGKGAAGKGAATRDISDARVAVRHIVLYGYIRSIICTLVGYCDRECHYITYIWRAGIYYFGHLQLRLLRRGTSAVFIILRLVAIVIIGRTICIILVRSRYLSRVLIAYASARSLNGSFKGQTGTAAGRYA